MLFLLGSSLSQQSSLRGPDTHPDDSDRAIWQSRAMGWSPERNALQGRVAVVAGATRGAGRGIATALGEAGATVVCTGRTTRTQRSDYDRAETIEETAEMVTDLGGTGVDGS